MDVKNKFVVPSYYVPAVYDHYLYQNDERRKAAQGVELSLNYNYDLPAGAFISLVRPFRFVYLYRRPLY